MKKTFSILLIAIFANFSFASTEVNNKDAKREIVAINKQIKKLETQKTGLTKKFNNANTELQEAQEKVEALHDKPKSVAYKTALKKTETLKSKIDEYSQSIQSITQQIDSLNRIQIINQENILEEDATQESAEVIEAKKEPTEESIEDSIKEPVDEIFVESVSKEESNKADSSSEVLDEDNHGKDSASYQGNKPSKSPPMSIFAKIWKFIKIFFWVNVGMIIFIILFHTLGKMGRN